jgi:hypothetical protein
VDSADALAMKSLLPRARTAATVAGYHCPRPPGVGMPRAASAPAIPASVCGAYLLDDVHQVDGPGISLFGFRRCGRFWIACSSSRSFCSSA